MADEKKATIFGIRHLSPAGAYYVRECLDRIQPELVLIEGPSDFDEMITPLTDPKVKPPVAIMAYTKEAPVRTILYPFAVYSPEYQAALWARENNCPCRFMDLPSGVILALEEAEREEAIRRTQEQLEREAAENMDGEEEGKNQAEQSKTEQKEQIKGSRKGAAEQEGGSEEASDEKDSELVLPDVYERLDQVSGEDSHETFWEHVLEQAGDEEAYRKGAALFGENIRNLSEGSKGQKQDGEPSDLAETNKNPRTDRNHLREAYMKRKIEDAVASGISRDKIVAVTGAYHVKGLEEGPVMSDKEIKALPCMEALQTLMPYSYYRLSMRTGYGAGNQAPAYYELLWKGFCRRRPEFAVYQYVIRLAVFLRRSGNPVSTASVIESVRLSAALAQLHGYQIPSLRDLRDGATTCIGHGEFSQIALGAANTETGSKIGSLPEGMSQTSIQNDFYQKLEELRLTKYKSMIVQDLQLDLRENLKVKSRKSAFMDLNRSFFLHQLRILGIPFAKQARSGQEKATWAELWQLQWTPEAEIQLVESVLKGDTVEQAASFVLKEQAESSDKISQVAHMIEEAYCCGMPKAAQYGTETLQGMAVEAASIEEIGMAAESLSLSVSYGDIRHQDARPLIPVLEQLFLRACLILPESCSCDDQGANSIITGMEALNRLVRDQDFIDEERWIGALTEVARRDDLNTKLSGLAAAILLEWGRMDNEMLSTEVQRRLSRGMPADLGAGWFEGLAMKNHYALIARMTLWEKLSEYIDTLDDEDFKRAVVFLRRAFADFTSGEKDSIAENLGELWKVNPQQVSEILNADLTAEEMDFVADLGDFDFDL